MGFTTRKLATLVKLMSNKNIAEERARRRAPASCTVPVQPTQALARCKALGWARERFLLASLGRQGWGLILSLNTPGGHQKAVQAVGRARGQRVNPRAPSPRCCNSVGLDRASGRSRGDELFGWWFWAGGAALGLGIPVGEGGPALLVESHLLQICPRPRWRQLAGALPLAEKWGFSANPAGSSASVCLKSREIKSVWKEVMLHLNPVLCL